MISVIYTDKFLLHKTSDRHPERPERLQAVAQALREQADNLNIQWIEPTHRDLRQYLSRFHNSIYLQKVEDMANQGGGNFYEDTFVSPNSFDVAMLAVSAWMDGVDLTLKTGYPSFALTRPPGHHALKDTGMGFCLFANAAISAHYALEQPKVERVAILDWDVHHGNGTQEMVENNPQIAFCSIHQSPFFPFTGREKERGICNNVLNIRVKQGYSIKEYKPIFEERVIPFLSEFQPDLIIVSAGYDANEADSLGWLKLQPEDYGVFTKLCLEITPKIVFGLEGGYELNSLAESVIQTIKACG
jgi:acetoin utilization deacetylase AcuC-like enzyme